MRFPWEVLLRAGCIILILLSSRQAARAACHSFADVISNGSVGVADNSGAVVGSCNIDAPFIPASTLKIPTSLAALKILGPGHRFTTELHLDTENNLYIKGYGDPLLVSEEVGIIAEKLNSIGIKKINGLFVDDSAFALEGQAAGIAFSSNPYDAPVGALSVNFNSVSIQVGKDQQVISGEKQTPLLPLMVKLGKGRKIGRHRINICTTGCNPPARIARYAVELFDALFRQAGIERTGPTGVRRVPDQSGLLLNHKSSKTLEMILASMLKYSSNFIANQVYLSCGAKQFGYPATWEKAQLAVDQQLVAMLGAATARQVHHLEGSGLARENRVTARTMLKILHLFQPHAHLLASHRGVLLKSGTLKNVYNYAGYLKGGNPYVIFLNQSRNTRTTVLDRLKLRKY